MVRKLNLVAIFISVFLVSVAIANHRCDFKFQSSIALDGIPKYKKNFNHFDYVDIQAKKGGKLKSYVLGGFDSLNPFLLKGISAEGLDLVYDTLMVQSLDEPYSQYGLIADGIALAPDRSWVVFHINPLAKFSDGIKVDAEDVKFSFDTLMSRGSVVFRQYYADVKEAKVLNNECIKFVFKTNKNRELPLILGQLTILPRHFYFKNKNNTFGDNVLEIPLGSGPYRVKSFKISRQIVYERNPHYWAKDLPVNRGFYNFDTLVYDYYKDDSVALKAFLKGNYDWRFESVAKVWARGYVGDAVQKHQIRKVMLENQLPSGMQGFFMNTRQKVFQNPLVREAIFYAFDGEWSIKNLFFSQYRRTQSYFDHSIYAMQNGAPKGEELALLKHYKVQLKDSRILTHGFIVPRTDGADIVGENLRENLKYARDLLKRAGYEIKDFKLIDKKTKKPLEFTLTLDNPAFVRLALAFSKNLEILGIKMDIQVVDSARYANLVHNFDYDMIVGVIPQSLSPGNEQQYFFSSKSALIKGSKNYSGIQDQVVDSLIKRLLESKTQQERIIILRSLDRVLSWGFYVIPHFYMPSYRIAYWNKIKIPEKTPAFGFTPNTWWENPQFEGKR